MIRVALSVAWREIRLCAYRISAVGMLVQRQPFRVSVADQHRLDSQACDAIAEDAERLARAMLDAEGRR